MSLIKSDVAGQYFVVGMDIAKDKRLGLTERGMMLTLLSLPPDWRFTIEGMVAILPDGRSRVRSTFKKLEDLGYVKRSQDRSDNGVYGEGQIEVFQKAIIVPEVSDEPMTDKPLSDFPTTDPQTQVINNISINHKSTIDKCVGTLSQEDYERLCSSHDKDVVDYQISRIKTNHYIGYMNFDKIDMMCREFESRRRVEPPRKKSSFHNYTERSYTQEQMKNIERMLLTR